VVGLTPDRCSGQEERKVDKKWYQNKEWARKHNEWLKDIAAKRSEIWLSGERFQEVVLGVNSKGQPVLIRKTSQTAIQ